MTQQQMESLIEKIKTSRSEVIKLFYKIDTALDGYSEEYEQLAEKAARKLKPVNVSKRVKKKKTSG